MVIGKKKIGQSLKKVKKISYISGDFNQHLLALLYLFFYNKLQKMTKRDETYMVTVMKQYIIKIYRIITVFTIKLFLGSDLLAYLRFRLSHNVACNSDYPREL